MKTIRLYGDMANRFGREFEFDVKSPAEAIRALCSQVDGFRAYLHEHSQSAFKIFAGSRNACEEVQFPCGDREIIRITPVVQGAGAAGRIVLGVVLLVAAYFTGGATAGSAMAMFSSAAGSMGMALVIGGVVELLTPKAKTTSTGESDANTPSYNFNGPTNTTAQGQPVPLAYGKLIVGSAVISAGMVTV